MIEEIEDALAQSFDLPHRSPIQPKQMGPDSTVKFRCHKDIACFNECCRNIDIMLTPYDILRLQKRLEMGSREFLARHTIPYPMDHHGMPGLKMLTKPETAECQFLTAEGCGVYTDRPAACRYYALGSMGVRKKGAADVTDIAFVVKEAHCLGHDEGLVQTVAEYRRQQGIEPYDEMTREWRDVVLKKRSSGPTIGAPSERSLDLFWMASYDLDGFRAFVESAGFQQTFDLDEDTRKALGEDDEALLKFAARFLKQTLFGENSIPKKSGADERRLASLRSRKPKVQGDISDRFDRDVTD